MKWARIVPLACIILLVFIFIAPTYATVNFEYTCNGEGATASTYSYFREPRIVESGFERGMKSGSFNYLEKGKVDLSEKIIYYYGNGTNKSNSTVDHTLKVDFDGERAISEFFGRGFFGNNRYLSAWKKIRYEETPNLKMGKKPWENRTSRQIHVDAKTHMDTNDTINERYRFDYSADIEDGVIETKDAVGWTNRSGARKFDIEHYSLTRGDVLNVTNVLEESEPWEVAAGPLGEWLPCCFSGTVPLIDQNSTGWPSQRVIATLEANRILPTMHLSTIYAKPSSESPIYRKREIQIGMSSYPQMPLQNTRMALAVANGNRLLPTLHLSSAYAPPIGSPVYWKREAEIGLRSLSPPIITLPNTVNSSLMLSEPLQESWNSSSLPSVPMQKSASCIGENCPANFFVTKTQSALNCSDNACDGYECIYTYDDDRASAGARTIPGEATRDIDVSLFVYEVNPNAKFFFVQNKEDDAKKEIYLISVRNSGDLQLENVILSAKLAKGMGFQNTSYLQKDRGIPEILSREPKEFKEDTETNIQLGLGSLAQEEGKGVIMVVYAMRNTDNTALSVTVTGKSIDGQGVSDSQSRAMVVERSGLDEDNQPCDLGEGNENCRDASPEWIKPFI